MKEILKKMAQFLDHKPDCQTKQDTREWREAALGLGSGMDAEIKRIVEFENTCTCGHNELVESINNLPEG